MTSECLTMKVRARYRWERAREGGRGGEKEGGRKEGREKEGGREGKGMGGREGGEGREK